MGREELKTLYKINLELRSLEQEEQMIRNDIYALQASDYSKSKVQNNQHSDLSLSIARLTKAMTALNAKWDELIEHRTRVRKKIERLQDPAERVLLVRRYIVCETWVAVAKFMNYSWAQTHRIHRSALKSYDRVANDIE